MAYYRSSCVPVVVETATKVVDTKDKSRCRFGGLEKFRDKFAGSEEQRQSLRGSRSIYEVVERYQIEPQLQVAVIPAKMYCKTHLGDGLEYPTKSFDCLEARRRERVVWIRAEHQFIYPMLLFKRKELFSLNGAMKAKITGSKESFPTNRVLGLWTARVFGVISSTPPYMHGSAKDKNWQLFSYPPNPGLALAELQHSAAQMQFPAPMVAHIGGNRWLQEM
ncbi:hypothetical protein IW262DRAFT_1302171 [Armillaria fumosa]|nr:hypothetical protein IW262DRAFT_1302171 [Armillaria fumosa]